MTRRKSRKTPADPHADREAAKYERPIPSRELILSILDEAEGPLGFDAVAGALGLHEDVDIEAFDRRLRAMQRDGQLVRNRNGAFLPVTEKGLIRGRVLAHPDGFGFLSPDEGGDDVFLAPRQMRGLFHGDRAVVRVMGLDHRGRPEGAVIEVLERNTHQVVGRFFEERGVAYVSPDNKRLPLDVLIPPEDVHSARSGQIVLAAIVEQPGKHKQPIGKIVEVLGEHMDPGMEIDIALRSYDLPFEWSEAVEAEARAFGAEVDAQAKRGRTDLRDTPLVTIDGEDARDFDDAVYCEPRADGGWRLLVAIADVSHYVQPGSALDAEARKRGTSVYFPGQVIPMLPEALSNGLCSLNPQVDRLALVADMTVSDGGALKAYEFYPAVIRSAARLTYTEVGRIVAERAADARKNRESLLGHLDALYDVFKALARARRKRGAIDFETQETRILFGEGRKIERIVPTTRNDAHRIIEECMIVANVAAARLLGKRKIPTLYRVHEGPSVERLEKLHAFLAGVGLQLGGGDSPGPKDYAALMRQLKNRPDAELVQTMLLRSLQQAVYAPDNRGHFGLAHSAYAHFTSPIRRYPDLLVHRGIYHALSGKKPATFDFSHNDMVTLGEHCSMTERRADEAVRDVVDWLKCEFMRDKVGETFDGLVSTVTSFGLFVQLKDVYVEGLVHVTALSNDYYRFDPVGQCLRGERGGRVYRLGDPLQVQVARVDLDERKIDFILPDAAGGKPQTEEKSRAKRRRRPRRKKSQ
ncbi:ribonuclease R [Acidihalobacter ferrooxydans]|uniref:Ribonuclease R n=1 Tax=Acidihalobacter ferrooxydans TaxID=1765967 RepID=A0A1P8UF33_9GAMM|nr:ribonuclease R [Acidihalobacter ferrooxydans]APZ42426.1 ribonuclease R [Acidihalobacter ferrooxydans]